MNRVGRIDPGFFAALAFDHWECSPGQRVEDTGYKPRLRAAFLAAVGHRLLCANHSLHDGDMGCRQHSKHNLIFDLSPANISRNYQPCNVEMRPAIYLVVLVHLSVGLLRDRIGLAPQRLRTVHVSNERGGRSLCRPFVSN